MGQKFKTHSGLQQGGQDEIDLTHLVNIIRRSFLRICVLTTLVAIIAAMFISDLPPIYKASTVLQLQIQQAKPIAIQGVLQNDINNKDYFQTQIEILRSDLITEKVISKLTLFQHPFYTQHKPRNKFAEILHNLKNRLSPTTTSVQIIDPQDFIGQIKSAVHISLIKNTPLLTISYEHFSADLAALIANTYADVYIQHNRNFRVQQTVTASLWLKDGVQVLKDNLNLAESNLTDFLQQENLIHDSGIDNFTATELQNLTTKLNTIRSELISAQTLYRQINQAQDLDLLTSTSIKALSNQVVIVELRTDYTRAKDNIAQLSKRYGPLHDKMIHANAQLSVAEDNAQKALQQLALGFKKSLTLLEQNESAVIAALEAKKADHRTLIKQKARYTELNRELTSSNELYNMFLMRLKETSLTNDLNLSTVTITDIAKTPRSPFKPKRALILVLVILLTLMLLVAHALITALFFVNQDNLKNLSVPLLGSLPNLKMIDKKFHLKSPQQLFLTNSMIFEATQSLRTSLQLSARTKKQQIIMLTSSTIAEGKSTSAIYLAMALAQSHKTIILEADMRKPSVRKKMGIPNTQKGLVDILTTSGNLNSYIWHDPHSKLAVLCAGELTDSPSNLLSSTRFASCLAILRAQYDYIIIDSPPSLLVSDAFIIGQHSDFNILVTRSNKSKIGDLSNTIELLAKHGVSTDGIILNQESLKNDKRYQYQYQYKKETALAS
ncbi:MAG: polysaccharide biosynthesis tyrosine autokinase [Moritella sp.]|uniref:GumC family protein n=1 Tax=Moritella sp. TaxID=78556 RepID=UPI002173E955|nr:polysaccharide biosynthesis tyrosine autokinase [Moritella sp.]MBL1417755.1 polysaccharide biosynthesis tyrosine autokinase [Moritella sp.]